MMNYKTEEICGIPCLVRYPADYNEHKTYPLLLFLHGAGSRGDDPSSLRENQFFRITETHTPFPFLTVAPQCPADETWFDHFEHLKALALSIAARPDADAERIYLIGASMGGYGTWQLAMSMPGLFAAAVPICGGGMYWNAGRMKTVPVWAFHGKRDSTVFCEESEKMVSAVRCAGGDAQLTIYPENGHDAWSDTYRNPRVFAWLLEHRKTGLIPEKG